VSVVRLLRASFAHVPRDPFAVGADAFEGIEDGALAIGPDGRILTLGDYAPVRRRYPDAVVVDHAGALVLPGLVDAHVHYPQVGAMGALGRPLLAWLDEGTLPHEERFADRGFARSEARAFLRLLAAHGTTTALVFGAHYPGAMEAFFAEAEAAGLRIASGLVVADRSLPDTLCTNPDAAYAEGRALAERWHGRGRLRYAVTPRFSLSSTPGLLAACGALARDVPGVLVTSHLNENPVEIRAVRRDHAAPDYLTTYERAGLVGGASVFAHDVHPVEGELARLGAAGAAVAHCPSSNAFLGSGVFPFAQHLRHGVRVALGTDVGAGVSLSVFHEGLAAYQLQMLQGRRGVALGVPQLLYLATAAGAAALGLGADVGDFGVGKEADLIVVRPRRGSAFARAWAAAHDVRDLVGRAFTLARSEAIVETWVAGEVVHRRR
jgi:guanine deaminase